MSRASLAFVLAAPHSGGGKTTVSLALASALMRKGLVVHACKCGPDYVDPGFLTQVCHHPCLNLDTWLMGEAGVRSVFNRQAENCDVVLVEGVMGLCDGKDPGSLVGSTLDVARVLDLPVLLVVGARGLARSIAPLVDGFARACDRVRVHLAGVIATCTGSAGHREILARALAGQNLPPLLLNLPRKEHLSLPSRQLGLVPAEEIAELASTVEELGLSFSDTDLDLFLNALQVHSELYPSRVLLSGVSGPDAGISLASPAGCMPEKKSSEKLAESHADKQAGTFFEKPGAAKKRLAVARDEAFCFYYEDNFQLLKKLGWDLVFFSPCRDRHLPRADALYFGGGYPEVFVAELAANKTMLADIAAAAADGTSIFAECGGYMYLARELVSVDGQHYPLCGVVDGVTRMGAKLRSLGYREVTFCQPLPFGLDALGQGRTVRGHEFHWSELDLQGPVTPLYTGLGKKGPYSGGIVTGPCHNVQASYFHAYFPSLDFASGGRQQVQARSGLQDGSRKKPCVVVLTGPSSVGKTTLAAELSRSLQARGRQHAVVSLDNLLAVVRPGAAPCYNLDEAESQGLLTAHDYHEMLRRTAHSQGLVICDHVLCGRADWIADLQATLAGIPDAPGARLLLFELSCPEETLIAREMQRLDRPRSTEHALSQAHAQQQNRLCLPGTHGLALQEQSPAAICAQVLAILEQEGLAP